MNSGKKIWDTKSVLITLGANSIGAASALALITGLELYSGHTASGLPNEVRKEMDTGAYHIVAYTGIGRELQIYTPEHWRPSLEAKQSSSVNPYRFESIELAPIIPKGDSLESYVNLQKLEQTYDKVMREGKIIQ